MFGLAGSWKRNDTRLRKLAERLDLATKADEAVQAEFERLARVRLGGAGELHAVCARFTSEMSRFLKHSSIALDPVEFQPDRFREGGPNLMQIHASGRIVQLEFGVPSLPVSTEEFREPYILQGMVRSFNQELLNRNSVEEHQIFFCSRRHGYEWRFFDARTYQSGPFDLEYLTSLLERLI